MSLTSGGKVYKVLELVALALVTKFTALVPASPMLLLPPGGRVGRRGDSGLGHPAQGHSALLDGVKADADVRRAARDQTFFDLGSGAILNKRGASQDLQR